MTEQQSNKSYVINPLTNKLIQVGGKTYNALIRESVIALPQDDKNPPMKKNVVKKPQIVLKKLENNKQAKQLIKKLPPPPENKAYVAVNNEVVLRNKKMNVKPETFHKLFSKASVIVNKKICSDKDLLEAIQKAGSIDDLPNKYKQKIETMLVEEVLRVPQKQKPTENLNVIIPEPKLVNELKQKKKQKINVESDYENVMSCFSDDSEAQDVKKKSNSSVRNKNAKQKLLTIIAGKHTIRPSPAQSSKTTIYAERSNADETSSEDDDDTDGSSEGESEM